jgi:hypothetical protein
VHGAELIFNAGFERSTSTGQIRRDLVDCSIFSDVRERELHANGNGQAMR